jgi:hypothetical protein
MDPAEINRSGLLDILAINLPVFFTNSPPVYRQVNAAFLKISNDEDAFLSHLVSSFRTAFQSGLSSWERQLAASGSIVYNPLYQKYYSMAASRLGSRTDPDRTAVKYLWEPAAGGRYDELNRLNNPHWADFRAYGRPVKSLINRLSITLPRELKRNRDYLRLMVARSLDPRVFERDATMPPVSFNLKVQTFLDHESTPIEDATAVWLDSEEQRNEWLRRYRMPRRIRSAVSSRAIVPFRPVGVLTISPLPLSVILPSESAGGPANPSTRNSECCEHLSFNPWNNVPDEHRPLGIVQRMRRGVYAGSRDTRFRENRIPNPFAR